VNRVATAAVDGAVVFTDIVGFTAFCAERGDEDALALLAEQEQVVRHVLPSDARLVKELGDGLMLWFPDAASAIASSVRLQTYLQARQTDALFPLWIRIGAHWGRQSTRGDDLVGHDVNVAARIVQMAAPREVLVSEATWARAGRAVDGIAFNEVGPALMKGLPEPIWLLRASPA
jgi:class 3 adenylate cyclase